MFNIRYIRQALIDWLKEAQRILNNSHVASNKDIFDALARWDESCVSSFASVEKYLTDKTKDDIERENKIKSSILQLKSLLKHRQQPHFNGVEAVIEVNGYTFTDEVKTVYDMPVVVVFNDNTDECKSQMEIVKEISRDHTIKFCSYNTGENPIMGLVADITEFPTTVGYFRGASLEKVIGFQSMDEFKDYIENLRIKASNKQKNLDKDN